MRKIRRDTVPKSPDLEAIKAAVNHCEQQKDALLAAQALIKKEIEDSKSDVKDVERLKEKADDDLKALAKEIGTKNKEKTQLNDDIKVIISNKTKLEKELDVSLSSQGKEAKAVIAKSKDLKNEYENDIKQLVKQRESLSLENEKVKQESELVKAGVKGVEQSLASTKQAIKDAEVDVKNLERQKKVLEGAITTKKDHLDYYNNDIATLQEKGKIEKQEVERLIAENEERKTELEQKERDIEAQAKKIFSMMAREERINKLEPQLQNLLEKAGYNPKINVRQSN